MKKKYTSIYFKDIFSNSTVKIETSNILIYRHIICGSFSNNTVNIETSNLNNAAECLDAKERPKHLLNARFQRRLI